MSEKTGYWCDVIHDCQREMDTPEWITTIWFDIDNYLQIEKHYVVAPYIGDILLIEASDQTWYINVNDIMFVNMVLG